MSEPRNDKLKRLLETLGDTPLVSSRWLRAHGYPSNLVARYVASGWLQSPARGVYLRKGSQPTWEGLLHTLQRRERLPVHVGGRFALAHQGHEHYLRLGESATVTLYGPAKLPAWASRLPVPERVQSCGAGPFDWPALAFDAGTPHALLDAQGLERLADDTRAAGLVFSTPERAMLEICDATPDYPLVHEANALMQGLATLRPSLVSTLLQHCVSVKAKRLFLALADRNHHAWLAHVNLQAVDLGRGKRVLVRGGRLNARYQITLPADLDEQPG